jgi:23S rRNA (uracil1939-C5)-methyltransferase
MNFSMLGARTRMQTSATFTAKITDLTHDAKGVADLDGQRLFVADALPGEEVLLTPRKRRRKYQEAELLSIAAPAASRVTPGCEYFGRCGGCSVQHMSYVAQVEFKQNVVAQSFARIGSTAPANWLEPETGPQWGYRRRARLGVRFVDGKGRALVGFRERATSYITDMDHCPVLVPPVGRALGDLAEVVGAMSNPRRIPQIEVAIGDAAGAIVVRMLEQPSANDERLLETFGHRYDLDVHVQTAGPGSVRAIGGPARKLFYSLEQFGIRLEFLPTDFIQVNAAVNEKMVAEAIERAELGSSDRVLDLYCGLGNFSLPLARRCGELLGIEGDAGLVARAARNAELNGLPNARFMAADLTHSEWRFLRDAWDVVVLDPPRTGAEAAVAQMAAMSPRRVIYVSCHPATLARDAKELCRTQGYELTYARVFDMFPNTHHVEVMAVFDRSGR